MMFIEGGLTLLIGIIFGVGLTRYIMGLTTKLIRKVKDGDSLDETITYDKNNEVTK